VRVCARAGLWFWPLWPVDGATPCCDVVCVVAVVVEPVAAASLVGTPWSATSAYVPPIATAVAAASASVILVRLLMFCSDKLISSQK
jgi:hypothetical protein